MLCVSCFVRQQTNLQYDNLRIGFEDMKLCDNATCDDQRSLQNQKNLQKIAKGFSVPTSDWLCLAAFAKIVVLATLAAEDLFPPT